MRIDHGILLLLLALECWSPAVAPPATYLDDAGTRFVTVDAQSDEKVLVSFRTVYAPGAYSHWYATGKKGAKGIEFSQKVNEGEPPAPMFLAAGQGSLTIKLKPGQAGVPPDTALSGIYHHISDDKITLLAKKDAAAAVPILDDAIRAAQLKAPSEDRAAYAEWKKEWPALRDRLLALSVPKANVPVPQSASSKGSSGPGSSLPADVLAAYWVLRAELTGGYGVNFINSTVQPGLKSGWEGNYDDGFGGFIQIFVVSNGDARFTMGSSRGPDSAGGNIEGKMPAKTLKDAKDGTSTGDFVDNNPEVKEGEMQTRMHFRRIGHFIMVESQYAERYAGRGWFDGIYVLRPPPKEVSQ